MDIKKIIGDLKKTFNGLIEKAKDLLKPLGNVKFFSDLADIFKSTDNKKRILAMVLIIFIVIFTMFGGCSSCGCSGCVDVSCKGCGGSGESSGTSTEPSDSASCAGSSNKGGKAQKLYTKEEITASTAVREYLNGAVTYFYPTNLYTFSENSEDLWASWCGDNILAKDGEFAIQTEFEYISEAWNSALGCYATNIEEALESCKGNAMGDPRYGDLAIGDKIGTWREYGGVIMCYLPIEGNDEAFARVYLIPYSYTQDEYSGAKAMELLYNDEVRAILGALELTTVDAIPQTTEKDFYVYPASEFVSSAKKATFASKGGEVHKVGKTIKSGKYELYIASVELWTDEEGYDIITINTVFTNNSKNTICSSYAIYTSAYQMASLDVVGNWAGEYIPAQPGQSVAYQVSYYLLDTETEVSLEVYSMVEVDGEYEWGEELDPVDIYSFE